MRAKNSFKLKRFDYLWKMGLISLAFALVGCTSSSTTLPTTPVQPSATQTLTPAIPESTIPPLETPVPTETALPTLTLEPTRINYQEMNDEAVLQLAPDVQTLGAEYEGVTATRIENLDTAKNLDTADAAINLTPTKLVIYTKDNQAVFAWNPETKAFIRYTESSNAQLWDMTVKVIDETDQFGIVSSENPEGLAKVLKAWLILNYCAAEPDVYPMKNSIGDKLALLDMCAKAVATHLAGSEAASFAGIRGNADGLRVGDVNENLRVVNATQLIVQVVETGDSYSMLGTTTPKINLKIDSAGVLHLIVELPHYFSNKQAKLSKFWFGGILAPLMDKLPKNSDQIGGSDNRVANYNMSELFYLFGLRQINLDNIPKQSELFSQLETMDFMDLILIFGESGMSARSTFTATAVGLNGQSTSTVNAFNKASEFLGSSDLPLPNPEN